ncbi:FAD-binding protein [Frigoribacterium salinisoli]
MHNWAENVEYSTSDLRRPTTVDEVQRLVTSAPRVKALGSRHSFNDAADTDGVQIALDALDLPIELVPAADGEDVGVRVGAGVTHARLAERLQAEGRALANLASLPHISVAGAVSTGTHGSGVGNPALSAAVRSVEIVRADGTLETVRRGDPRFDATVVGVGALGVVVALTLDTLPTFDVAQTVYEGIGWDAALGSFDDLVASAYSVSLFTGWTGDEVAQVWHKARVGDAPGLDPASLGGRASGVPLHPLPDVAADAVTQQLGVPGPWLERLPHFRADFTPSNGAEIQSEYLVPAEHAPAAIEALRAVADRFAHLLFVGEIRTMAPDAGWLSPSGGRQSVAFHFTWQRRADEVLAALPHVEEALAPFDPRPHWGKVSTFGRDEMRRAYPRLDEFAAHAADVDPDGRFRNAFLARTVLGGEDQA